MQDRIVPYEPGVVEVRGGAPGVLLTVRRSPNDVVDLISVELSRDDARTVAQALLDAIAYSEQARTPPPEVWVGD